MSITPRDHREGGGYSCDQDVLILIPGLEYPSKLEQWRNLRNRGLYQCTPYVEGGYSNLLR